MSSNVIETKDASTGRPMKFDLYNNTVTMSDADGRLVTMDLGQADVHIDSALSNYAAGYKLQEGVADMVCPVVPVEKASNKFYTWDKDDVFQEVTDLSSTMGGQVKEISPRLSTSSYSTVNYALGAFVPTELQANADAPLKVEMKYMKRVMDAMLQARERRVASLLTTSGNFSFTSALGGTAKWNGGSASDPVKDLFSIMESSLLPVTDIVMSEQVYHDFITNANVQKYIASKVNVPGLPNPSGLAQPFEALLGLPKIHVAAMKYKSGSSTYGYVWGTSCALLHVPGSLPADGMDVANAYTFRWNGGAAPDGSMQGGFQVRSYYDPRRGPRGGRAMVVTVNDAEVTTSTFVGGLITGCHQLG